jgi:hypothetical protein
MKARFAYPLAFFIPSAMAALLSAFVVGGAAGGILWLFVFGDDPWPGAADKAVMMFVTLAAATTLAALLFASYSFGKKREVRGGLSRQHLVLAFAISILLPAFALLYEWQVGNIGGDPIPVDGSFQANATRR